MKTNLRQSPDSASEKPMKIGISATGQLWSWQVADFIGFSWGEGSKTRFSPHWKFEAIAGKPLIGGVCLGRYAAAVTSSGVAKELPLTVLQRETPQAWNATGAGTGAIPPAAAEDR